MKRSLHPPGAYFEKAATIQWLPKVIETAASPPSRPRSLGSILRGPGISRRVISEYGLIEVAGDYFPCSSPSSFNLRFRISANLATILGSRNAGPTCALARYGIQPNGGNSDLEHGLLPIGGPTICLAAAAAECTPTKLLPVSRTRLFPSPTATRAGPIPRAKARLPATLAITRHRVAEVLYHSFSLVDYY